MGKPATEEVYCPHCKRFRYVQLQHSRGREVDDEGRILAPCVACVREQGGRRRS